MPGYINHPQYAQHNWNVPYYGQRIQYAPLTEAPPPETSREFTRSQSIVGTLLYNPRTIYPTLLVPLINLASQLSTATSTTIDAVSHLLDYCSSHPEASVRYYTSAMHLKTHSDTSYLSDPKAKSRIGGYF
jgi:hypothetical protein